MKRLVWIHKLLHKINPIHASFLSDHFPGTTYTEHTCSLELEHSAMYKALASTPNTTTRNLQKHTHANALTSPTWAPQE